MKYDLSKFEELVEQKYIRKSVKDDLVIYNYTEQTTQEKYWNEYTRAARGLILNKNTGEVVAQTFPKFFNLGEMPETSITNLPDCGYTVAEKCDGSLGIIYHHDNKWNVATKGSFNSEQSIKAEEILKKYDLSKIPTRMTLLTEIIYPENKIVVNYKGEEKLILIGMYDREDGLELPDPFGFSFSITSEITGIPARKSYKYTFEEMIALQKTLPKDEEGFVVRFDNGLRVKIKGEEYLKIHKIVSNLSPLSFWEVMKDGKVQESYIQQVPEEFKNDFEPIVKELENSYIRVKNEVIKEFESIPNKDSKKEVGLYIKDNLFLHGPAMFPMLMNKTEIVDNYISKTIRPKGNVLN